MTTTLRFVLTASCLFAIAGAVAAIQPAQNGQPAGAPARQPERGPGGPGRQETMSVGRAMKGMNRAVKTLAEQVSDASKKDENLRLINDAQRNCAIAKGLGVPQDALKHAKDGAEKAKMTDHFRKDLIKAMRLLLDIETDIADGKADSVKAHLDELVKMRDEAHEEMGVEEE